LHLEKALSKEMGMFRFFHCLAYDYLQSVEEKEKIKLLDLVASSPLAFHHSYEGVLVLGQCLKQGAKYRKGLLRAIKGNIPWLARHDEGYRVIMLCLHITDDTPLLQRVITDGLLMTKTSGSVLKKKKKQKKRRKQTRKRGWARK